MEYGFSGHSRARGVFHIYPNRKSMARYSKIVKQKKKKSPSIVSAHVQAFIARRLYDVTAGIMVLGGLFLFVAMISHHGGDPSWNMASEPGEVQNWAGAIGAYVSDFWLQTIGYAAFLMAGIFVLWGVRLWKRLPFTPFAGRLCALIAGVILSAIVLARVPAGHFIVQAYAGGSAGTLILDSVAGVLNPFIGGYYEHLIVALICAIPALACLSFASFVSAKMWLVGFKRALAASFYGLQLGYYYAKISLQWVKYHNRPEEKPQAAPKPQKPTAQKLATQTGAPNPSVAEKTTASPPQNNTPQALQDTSQDTPQDMKTTIKVVSPQKGTSTKAKNTSGTLNLSSEMTEWEMPPTTLLQDVPPEVEGLQLDEAALQGNAEMLQTTLSDFNVSGEIVSIHPGPVVTLYELEPAPGVKSARVVSLSDDIARSMAAISVRCAVIPGRNVIGVELPNDKRQTVYLRDLLETEETIKSKAKLPLILGKDISGKPIIADLAKMPHLLIAGTTGSGKSVAINTMVLSLLFQLPPEKCRLIMIDPKMLELSVYDDIPHLLAPVVTEPGKAVVSLKWAVQEMENRYRAMSKLGVRNIEGYNERLRDVAKKGETLMRKVQTGFDPETGKPIFEDQEMDLTELPYIVIIVDEFADLMLVAGKDVENAIQRLAQMARAAGIHLIMATQRPSVDVITGVIKANFPTRISFQVTSKIDSRTILGEGGAEQLLGMGDMLYMAPGGRLTRVHGPFVSDDEVETVVNFLKAQGTPQYLDEVTDGDGIGGDSEVMNAMFGSGDDADSVDELYDKAVAIVARERKASTSFIQRHLQIGYNRAARIVEEMERQGVIGPANHVGKREILVGDFSDA
jgi:S-DNA-T family DNA segregation ATPase FtsK/SpoIIIE